MEKILPDIQKLNAQSVAAAGVLNQVHDSQLLVTQLTHDSLGNIFDFTKIDDYKNGGDIASFTERVLAHYFIFHHHSRSYDDVTTPSYAVPPQKLVLDGWPFQMLMYGEFGEPRLTSGDDLKQREALLLMGYTLNLIQPVNQRREPGLGLVVTQLQGIRSADKDFTSHTYGLFKTREIMLYYLEQFAKYLQLQQFCELKYVGIQNYMNRKSKQNPSKRRKMARRLGYGPWGESRKTVNPHWYVPSISESDFTPAEPGSILLKPLERVVLNPYLERYFSARLGE